MSLDDPWFRVCASRRLLDIANVYLGLWSKLEYADLWYTIPQPASVPRSGSQRWHRDYDDQHLLKVFLYLSPVGTDAGPFEYVAGSVRGAPYGTLWPWRPNLEGLFPEALEPMLDPEAIRTITGPKGTMIFCNTSCLHRGGLATGSPRILATGAYCSPASLAALTQRYHRFVLPQIQRLDPELRFALS
jgi:hypothetical protein